MSSWIYVISKFTSEALLLEGLAISLLLSSYAAFYVLRKRKYGPIEEWVPSGLMKVHLNQLSAEADRLKAQLFGLTNAQNLSLFPSPGHSATSQPLVVSSGPSARETELSTRLALLEMKISEQMKLTESAITEKSRLEKEILELKSKAQKPGTGSSADAAEVVKLNEKTKLLEARLAEYSIIEDDLANLKRLQQENTQLRSSLQAAGIAPPPSLIPGSSGANAIAVGTGGPSTAAPASGALQPAAVLATASASVPTAIVTAQVSPDSASDGSGNATPPAVDIPDLATMAPAPVSEGAGPASGLTPDSEKTPLDAALKSDEDLVAEFEKMLNG